MEFTWPEWREIVDCFRHVPSGTGSKVQTASLYTKEASAGNPFVDALTRGDTIEGRLTHKGEARSPAIRPTLS